jgi:hypothetical protein
VIEPYITACHYVTNNQEENDSRVYNFTIEEYLEVRRFGAYQIAQYGQKVESE